MINKSSVAYMKELIKHRFYIFLGYFVAVLMCMLSVYFMNIFGIVVSVILFVSCNIKIWNSPLLYSDVKCSIKDNKICVTHKDILVDVDVWHCKDGWFVKNGDASFESKRICRYVELYLNSNEINPYMLKEF